MSTSTPASDMHEYFSSLYSTSEDPYKVRSRWYERRKIDLIVASLTKEHYLNVFEPGAGTGELSLRLAPRSTHLHVYDISAKAIDVSQKALEDYNNITFSTGAIPHVWPKQSEKFDLIVLSEILYFLTDLELEEVIDKCQSSLAPEGSILLCNWKYDFKERKLDTKFIHSCFESIENIEKLISHDEEDFILEIFSFDAVSIAKDEEII